MSNPIVVEYEALYRKTRNPLYVWEALGSCQRGEMLPSWIFDYLVGCSRSLASLGLPAWDQPPPDRIESRHLGVLDLADRVCADKLDAAAAVNLVARALGLQRGAKDNAFSNLAQVRKGFREAWHIDVTRAGTKQEAARAEIESYLAQQVAAKSRKPESFKSQVNRRVKRARALLAAQSQKKGGGGAST